MFYECFSVMVEKILTLIFLKRKTNFEQKIVLEMKKSEKFYLNLIPKAMWLKSFGGREAVNIQMIASGKKQQKFST